MQDVMPYPYVLSEAERDWRFQCRDEEDPPKGPTCRECRFSCQADCLGKDGPWVCLLEAMEYPKGQASAVVINPGQAACEGFEDSNPLA